jgi:hypothetical protein
MITLKVTLHLKLSSCVVNSLESTKTASLSLEMSVKQNEKC